MKLSDLKKLIDEQLEAHPDGNVFLNPDGGLMCLNFGKECTIEGSTLDGVTHYWFINQK